MRRRGENAKTLSNPWRLTVAELRVVALVCQGLGTHEICDALVVEPKTLQSHFNRIFQKVGVFDRVGLMVAVLHEPAAREICFPDLVIADRDVG